jgi:isopenicillin-N N-acyltransferase-like protein
MSPVPLINVSGPPAEWGGAYGAAAAGRIGMNVELYARRFRDQAGLDSAAVRRAGAEFRLATRDYHARIAAALDAMAEAAGADVDDIYALNARTELLHRASPPDGSGGGCTSIGVLGAHTADGHTLLAQNWDWHPDQRDAMVLLRTTDERGHTILTLAEAGMPAKMGLNSAGLGLCVNLLGSDRDGIGVHRPTGVPYHVVVRAALEADSLGAALRDTVQSPRNSSVNLLLGQAGEGGEIIDLELAPGDAGWLHPVDGLITHANHFEAPMAVRDTIKDWGGSSLYRSARARRLLAGTVSTGKTTVDNLTAALRDHMSFPVSICRHVDERDAPVDRSESVYSVLLDLDDRRLAVAPGPPCGGEYTFFDLLG